MDAITDLAGGRFTIHSWSCRERNYVNIIKQHRVYFFLSLLPRIVFHLNQAIGRHRGDSCFSGYVLCLIAEGMKHFETFVNKISI